jgi:hypothetical protein
VVTDVFGEDIATAPEADDESESVPPEDDIPCPGRGTEEGGGELGTVGSTGSTGSVGSRGSVGSSTSVGSSSSLESSGASTSSVSPTASTLSAPEPDSSSADNPESDVAALPEVAVAVFDVESAPVDPEDGLLDVSLGADDPDSDPEDEPVVSALATPGDVATTTPIPKAAANAPTRPT